MCVGIVDNGSFVFEMKGCLEERDVHERCLE
jgi:hypothetical protein